MPPKKKCSAGTFLWTEVQLEPDIPLIIKPNISIIIQKDESAEKIPKIKKTRTPSLYNKMLGEFMKQVSQEDKENSMSQRDKMLRAQSLYRSWKAQQN